MAKPFKVIKCVRCGKASFRKDLGYYSIVTIEQSSQVSNNKTIPYKGILLCNNCMRDIERAISDNNLPLQIIKLGSFK